MKKTLLQTPPQDLPERFIPFIEGAKIYDSSCSREANVYFIDKDDGYYLKASAKGTLKAEAEMTAFFNTKGLAASVLDYSVTDRDWLLTSAVRGSDCTHSPYIDDPRRLCDLLATELRKLHELDFRGCPVTDRMSGYLALADKNYRDGIYDLSFSQDKSYKDHHEAYAILSYARDGFKNDTLIHGDYCLPNVMLDDWKLSAFIDLGNGGAGDRHVDLFWGTWTLRFNLGTDEYKDRFLDAYGRDRVDNDILRAVAAAEVFG